MLLYVVKSYQLTAMNGGPLSRGIDPLVDVIGDPNDTNPAVHTCLTAIQEERMSEKQLFKS